MGVRDANAAGDVHGGWIMKLCDDAAVIAASRLAQRRVVTVAVDGMRFRQNVRVNDVLTLRAKVNASWRTSMEVGVRVEAEDVLAGTIRHTLTAYVTLVALNESATPSPVPPLLPETEEDRRRWDDAQRRRELRLTDLSRDQDAKHAAPRTTTQSARFAQVLLVHRALRQWS